MTKGLDTTTGHEDNGLFPSQMVKGKERGELVSMLPFYGDAFKYRDQLLVQEFYFMVVLAVSGLSLLVKSLADSFGSARAEEQTPPGLELSVGDLEPVIASLGIFTASLLVAAVAKVFYRHMINIDEDRKDALACYHAILTELEYRQPHRGWVGKRASAETPRGLLVSLLDFARYVKFTLYAASLLAGLVFIFTILA